METIRSFRGFVAMYVDGFRNLTWGRPLWVLIIVKLVIMFAVLRVFFFPNVLNSRCETEEEKSDFVYEELWKKQNNQ